MKLRNLALAVVPALCISGALWAQTLGEGGGYGIVTGPLSGTFTVTGSTNSAALVATGGSSNGNGVTATGNTAGSGIAATGGSTGIGGVFVAAANYGATVQGDTTSPAKAALRIVPQDADPATSPAQGDAYVNSTTGRLATYNGSAFVPAGGGCLVTLSGDVTLSEIYDGCTFIIDSNAADRIITVPTTLRQGFLFRVVCNSTAKKVTVQFSGTERYRSGGDLTSEAGTAVLDGAAGASTGYMFGLQKVSAGFAFTTWQNIGAVGAPALN
jgi:hypothetical protein